MRPWVLATVIGMMLVTYLPRMLPIVVLSRVRLPEWFGRWLSFVPVAVLSALLVPSILVKDGAVWVAPENKPLLAALPTFLIALKTRNLFASVLAGLAVIITLNLAF